MDKVKFATMFNPHKTEPSPAGEHIYKWQFLDEKGELKEEERNVYEQIQSFKRQTDFKKRLELEGEIENNGHGLYLDTTQLGGSYSDLDKYLGDLVARIKTDINAQDTSSTTPETTEKSGEAPPKSPEMREQTNPQPEQGGNE